MEPRKWKYNNNRIRNHQKVTTLLSIIMTYVIISFFLKSLPVSYAWFSAATSSKGQIINSSTSDLIKMIPQEITYDNNGKVQAKLSIQNISKVDIPLRVDLILNNQVLDSSSVLLYQNDTFSTGWEEIKEIPLETKDIQFRIIGFNGYINEVISYDLDQEKVKSTISSNNIDYQVKMDEEKPENDPSKQTTNTEVESSQGISKNSDNG